MHQHIPFNKPYASGKEMEYIAQAIEKGHLSGDGPFSKLCRNFLESELSAKSVLLTTSCTHALEMSALLLDIKPDDEFIVSPFTFVSTANAFVLRGAKPVFADIRRDTKNFDENLIEKLITKKTKAIVPVHYAGVGCEMDKICELASHANIAIVEDNAHGLFGKYRGRKLGSFGQMSTLSFHETKNIQCGEGGALVINDDTYSERAEIIREKGTNRARFFRGQVDKYSWVDIGSSYLPSDLLAAYLYGQLEHRQFIQNRRRLIWERYREGLKDWALANDTQLPCIPVDCEQSYHMFYMVMPTIEMRDQLIEDLKKENINSVFHYLPLNNSQMMSKMGYSPTSCPIAEEISDRIIRLPFFVSLSEEQQDRVIDSITSKSVSLLNSVR